MKIFGVAEQIPVSEVFDAVDHLLFRGERVLGGFRTVRDVTAITDFRLIHIDRQGPTGSKRVELSVLYRAISRFAVDGAGLLELESVLFIWLVGDPTPIELKMSKGTDTSALQRMLAALVLKCPSLPTQGDLSDRGPDQ